MNNATNLSIIRSIISSSKSGAVFVATDFVETANKTSVNTYLSRLEDEGFIRRIIRGVYYKPAFNELSREQTEPLPDDVAHAIARNFGWTIVPCGDTALNLLGLSDRIPSAWVYVSDGTYKEYTYNKTTIKFKRTTNKEISKLSYKTALVVQALKTLGKESVKEAAINKLKISLTAGEKQTMLTEAKAVTAWIYEYIKTICKG